MHRLLLFLLALAITARAAPAAADSSIRCEGGIVSEGDARIDLLGKCGLPALQDGRVGSRTQVATAWPQGGVQRSVGAVVEEWTYDFGPRSFVEVVTLVNGRVRSVERRGYGYSPDPRPAPVRLPRAACSDLAGVHEGDGKLDVLARCGEPALRDAWEETRSVVVGDAKQGLSVAESTTVELETWTYDLGRNSLVQFVTFENGRVVRIRSGSYGYAD
jgi:hypothetical protein